MFENRNTLVDNNTIKGVLENIFKENGYEIFNYNKLKDLDNLPEKYVLTNARFKSIYNHNTNSDFLIVNLTNGLRLRVAIKFQKHSGSVDEKLPYFYINSVVTHNDDVLFIIEGDGFKKGAKDWLRTQVKTNWLNYNGKNLYINDLVGSIALLEKVI